jgi:hypothetical protein
MSSVTDATAAQNAATALVQIATAMLVLIGGSYMLNDLKLVQGAVAAKDYVPELTYFRIQDQRIYGFNGVIAISTPTDLAVTAMPKAKSFVKAVEKLPEGAKVVLNLTATGKLSIKAGNFRVYVECHADDQAFPHVAPAGDRVPLPGDILPILRTLAPFMGIDASRGWAMGILFKNQSAYATNNIVLVEHWLPLTFPTPMTIPSEAIKEMLRIGIEPTDIQLEANAVTFHYATGAWLRTQLNSIEWPDLSRVLDRDSAAVPIPVGFFDAVNRLDAFMDKSNRLHIRGGTLATSEIEGEGAAVDLDDFGGAGCHNLKQVAKLDSIATHMEFSAEPRPCLFFGNMLRGAIIGMRSNDAV